MSCGGVAGKCAARKSHLHIVAPVVTAVTVSLLGGRSLVFCLRLQWYLMIWPAMPLPHWVSGAVLAVNVLQKAKLLLWQHKFYTTLNSHPSDEMNALTDSYIWKLNSKQTLMYTKRSERSYRLTKLQPDYHLWFDQLQAAADQSTPKHSKTSNHHPIIQSSNPSCLLHLLHLHQWHCWPHASLKISASARCSCKDSEARTRWPYAIFGSPRRKRSPKQEEHTRTQSWTKAITCSVRLRMLKAPLWAKHEVIVG